MIKIKIINPKSISIFSYYIKISNRNGIVSEGYTNNNCYIFNNKNKDIYKLEIYNKYLRPFYKKIYFIAKDNLTVFFDNYNHFFSLCLIDKNYNMPIKEGIINLWKKKNK